MTLSYNGLGQNGRLGNQMFQYAAIKGIARQRGLDFCIPSSAGQNEWTDHMLTRYFTLNQNVKYGTVEDQIQIKHNGFHFDSGLFYACPDGVDLSGSFQSEKYFSHISDEIVEDFTFKTVNVPKPFNEYVAVHVRHGDYVGNQGNFPVLSASYYESAIALFNGSYPIVVLSDDIPWCRQNIKADLYYEGSQIEDLYLMTQATHNVIANSSFSWWGAWLNRNLHKTVISPKLWFGPDMADFNLDDLRPLDWVQM